MKRVILLSLAVVLLAGLTSAAPILSRWLRDGTGQEAAVGVDEVLVADSWFTPSVVEVQPGTTVTWRFTDGEAHNVVFADGAGSPVQGDGIWQRSFTAKSDLPYRCTLHPFMDGRVVVR